MNFLIIIFFIIIIYLLSSIFSYINSKENINIFNYKLEKENLKACIGDGPLQYKIPNSTIIKGIGLTKNQVLTKAYHICNKNKLCIGFNIGLHPTQHYWIANLKRGDKLCNNKIYWNMKFGTISNYSKIK